MEEDGDTISSPSEPKGPDGLKREVRTKEWDIRGV